MSYLVIARKWRPQTFEEVVGQPHVTRTLQNAIRLDRIAHAYLFTGARGVGKTSIARILAKALNCEKGPAPSPCNQCSNCREIAQGNAVDVLEIDGASNRGIDNIRELRETVRYRPAKGRFKVYIIDEVHMLTAEAFNALLKTLEEPPPHVIFIFATTEPHKIPATILSRCQRFDFRRLTLQQLVEHLRKITAREGTDFSAGVLYAIAREADGSMRDAQSLLEQLMAFSGDGLPDEEILDILGVIDRQSVLRAGAAVLSGDAEACLDLVEDLYRRGIDSRRFSQHLCDHFRNLLFVTLADGREERLDVPDEEKKLLKELAAQTTPDSLHVYFQMLLRGEEEIRRSSMPKIALEMLLLRMAQLPRLESIDAVLDRIGSLERTLKEGQGEGGSPCMLSESQPALRKTPLPAPPKAPSPVRQEMQQERKPEIKPAPETPSAGVDDIAQAPPPAAEHLMPEASSSEELKPMSALSLCDAVERWPGFVAFIENRNPILWAKVSHCGVRVSGDSLELAIPDIYEKSVNDPEFLQKLDEASETFFGSRFQWVIITKASNTTKGSSAQRAGAPKPSGGKQIVNHPAVQQAIEILGAELVEVKPLQRQAGGSRRTEGARRKKES
ncbi:MAG: DNA polymerase III subunit gamma/tau [Syntrophobacteraceae bacterium]